MLRKTAGGCQGEDLVEETSPQLATSLEWEDSQ